MQNKNEATLDSAIISRRQALMRFLTAMGGAALAPSVAFAQSIGAQNDIRGMINSVTSSDSLNLVPSGGSYILRTTGIPNHPTGTFPNPNCPCSMAPMNRKNTITQTPQLASSITPLNYWLFGIGLNGVVFDPSGPFFNQDPTTGWQFEVMSPLATQYLGIDSSHGHVQPSGEYHYHGMPQGLYQHLLNERAQRRLPNDMVLLGFAADGFPIYGPTGYSNPSDPKSPLITLRPSYQLLTGPRPSGSPGGNYDGTFVQDYQYVSGLGDLDECNGRFGVTPEFPKGIYHYHVTSPFPFIPRFYNGTPDASFSKPANSGSVAQVPPALMAAFKRLISG